jgi:formiminoglutamase
MKPKLPILVIIPHGGTGVPDEFAGNEALTKFDLLFESDTCANALFSFEDRVAAKIDTDISRLFVDLDREPLMLPPRSTDGVIKKETLTGKPVFIENAFPDEIAIANVLRRYYYAFHATVEKIIKTGGIKLIVECHTMMAVGPLNAADPGKPRPLMTVTTVTRKDGAIRKTLPDELSRGLTDCMRKSFTGEDTPAAGRFAVNRPAFQGHILDRYGGAGVPMVRLSLSRALYLNDRYFFYEDLRIDELRIGDLREKLWSGIARFYRKYF